MSRMNGDTSTLATGERFQVVLQLLPINLDSQEELANALELAVAALVKDAAGVALGPVGSADLAAGIIDLEFTMDALSPALLHAKLGEVLRVLEAAGFEYAGSRDERVDAPRQRELQPA